MLHTVRKLQQPRRCYQHTLSDGSGGDAPSPAALDLRLVSVECDHDDGGDAASVGSSGGGARQRVLWPCLYFQSIDDMVTSLVACGLISADDAKLLKKECARFRLRCLAARGTTAGKAIAYLLGKDLAAHPGTRERAALGVHQPIVFPDEEPLEWVQRYIDVEEEHHRAHPEAFYAALKEAMRIEKMLLRRSIREQSSSDNPSHQGETKTPRPESRAAAAVAMVTDARPSAAAGFRAPDGLDLSVQPHAHALTPTLPTGAALARQNVLVPPDPGSSVRSPCAAVPENRAVSGAATAAIAGVLTPASVAAEKHAEECTKASNETTGKNDSFPIADEDDDAETATEARPDHRDSDVRPSGSASEAPAEGDQRIGASKGGKEPDTLPRGARPHAPPDGNSGNDSTGADGTTEETSRDDEGGSVCAASSTATVISSDGSAFASPSPSGRATRTSSVSANRRKRSSSAKKRSDVQASKRTPTGSKDQEPEMRRLSRVPAFSDVKQSLRKAGYDFTSGGFARPTGESFKSEEDFRRDLSEHGLDDYNGWSEKERGLVSDWVRYTHVNFGTSRNYEVLDISMYEEYRERLGIRYKDGYYVLPNDHRVDMELDLRVYLSRCGLPAECSADALSSAERLSFAMFVADSHKPFERKAIHTPGKKRRARLSLDSSGAFSPQIQRSPAHADGSMESKKSSVPSNASPRARRQGAPSPPSRINSVETAGRVVAEVEVDSSSPSPSIAISPLTRSSPNQTSSKSRRQILMACKDLPTKSSEIVYPPNSSFEASVKKVESFVRRVIASEGGHGSSEDMPAFLYVCGAPGLGKTAAVRACCDRLAKERRDDDIRKPRVCYVNASSMDASPQPDAVLLQRIAETLEMNSKFPQIKRIKSSMTTKKAQVVLIVDEIDILLSETDDASSSVKSKQEEALVMLADWAGDPDVSIGVIGISNRKGNTKYERLKQLGRFEDVVDFLPYTKSDITHIVEALVGPSVIHKQALEFIGNKTELFRSGDVRFAFEMVSKAANFCMESLSETELNATPDPDVPLIKLPAVFSVFKSEDNRVKTAINELPTTGQALLVILSTLAEEETQYATVLMLKNFASSVSIRGNDVISSENFVLLLSTLCDNGLVEVGGKSFDSLTLSDISNCQVRLGRSLDEVKAVVNDELCKNSVLAEVRDKVRQHRNRFKAENKENPTRGKKK